MGFELTNALETTVGQVTGCKHHLKLDLLEFVGISISYIINFWMVYNANGSYIIAFSLYIDVYVWYINVLHCW